MMKRACQLVAVVAVLGGAAGAARADGPSIAGVGSSNNVDYAAYEQKKYPSELGESRRAALEISPLDWLFNQAGLTFELMLARHHGLVLKGYYWAAKSDPDANFGRTNLFQGGAGELGYRWYSSEDGPRGFFVGPSFIGGYYHAKSAGDANPDVTVDFGSYGFAVDGGYQAIVADCVVIGLGAGVQYSRSTRDNPDQAWPVSLHANDKAAPRFLLSLGFAF